MKHALSILLVFSFLAPAVNKVSVYVSFKKNQDYISKVLCENKDNITLSCKGNCVLMKRLKAQEEEKEKRTSQEDKEVFFVDELCYEVSSANFNEGNVRVKKYAYTYSFEFLDQVFKPPRLV